MKVGADGFLDELVEEVMGDLDLASPPPISPEVSGVCGEANALVARLDAGDASATHRATQWLNQRLRGVIPEALLQRPGGRGGGRRGATLDNRRSGTLPLDDRDPLSCAVSRHGSCLDAHHGRDDFAPLAFAVNFPACGAAAAVAACA